MTEDNKIMKKFSIVLIFATLTLLTILAQAEEKNNLIITVNPGKYSDYYHLKYTLTKDNFLLPENTVRDEDAQFDVLINKDVFPVPAPNCRKYLILRMPSSLSSRDDTPTEKAEFEKSMKEKEKLFNRIKEVADGKLKEVQVIIELNPYVTVISKNPLKLKLDYCNIFFRYRGNYYIDNLDPISTENVKVG